ncbi:MAG: Imm59 family immunity protein [Bacillota bacterium]
MITINEAKEIMEKEKLKRFIWFDEHPLRENGVGIKVDGNQWTVYVTDERASIVSGSITYFNDESEALDNFIKRLRTEKILFNN